VEVLPVAGVSEAQLLKTFRVSTPSLSVFLPLDETEFERIFRNIRRADLVPEVVVVIFYTVLPEYLQKKGEIDLVRRERVFLPHATWNKRGGRERKIKRHELCVIADRNINKLSAI
jgi:hypothetical protein